MLSLISLAVVASLSPPSADTVIRLPRGGTIDVSVLARPVILNSGTGDLVTVEGARVDQQGSRLTIQTDRGRPTPSTPVTITVPTWATVEMEVVNGSITLSHPPAELYATTVNGRIESTGGTGSLKLESVTGDVVVRHFRGTHLVATTVSGAVTIDGATGTVRVNAINEAIVLRNLQGNSITAESTNGRIDWVGPLLESGEYHFGTHNGAITLSLPSTNSARLHGEMVNGTFSTTLPAVLQGLAPSRRDPTVLLGSRFMATFGTGQATVTLTTFNGTIQVRRATEP